MSGYTPGEWSVEVRIPRRHGIPAIVAPNGAVIAYVRRNGTDADATAEAEANAKLLADAPRLLMDKNRLLEVIRSTADAAHAALLHLGTGVTPEVAFALRVAADGLDTAMLTLTAQSSTNRPQNPGPDSKTA